LLQESHFYPFGQEISPLSSKALLKTPNERMLQQNEWDEEFGMNLHDFDAKDACPESASDSGYDASIGRFWGVDVYADQQFPLSPYHYAANNPVMMQDPDGKFFVMAALLVGKLVAKKIGVAKVAAFFAKKGVAKAVSAAANISSNWKNIKDQRGGLLVALGYGAVGALGSWAGGKSTLLGIATGGALNVGFDAAQGNFDDKGWYTVLGSFNRGAMSSLVGKTFSKSFKNGAIAGEMETPTGLGYKSAKKLFSGPTSEKFKNYALKGAGTLIEGIEATEGRLKFGHGLLFFGTGVASTALNDIGISEGTKAGMARGIGSLLLPAASQLATDYLSNSVKYYVSSLSNEDLSSRGKWKWTSWKDWYKSYLKAEMFGVASFWGNKMTREMSLRAIAR
jgi:RHS repeat-associated protein